MNSLREGKYITELYYDGVLDKLDENIKKMSWFIKKESAFST